MSPPRTCTSCAAKPVARKTLRFCFDCLPGGPHTPPPCRKCGVDGDYFSAGLCSRCHQYAPQPVGSCLECHAWGATRTHKWLCRACINWRKEYPTLDRCGSCQHTHHVGRGGWCRLCWRHGADARQATRRLRPYRPIDVAAANREGQQLFFADMGRRSVPRRVRVLPPPRPPRRRPPSQLDLFDAPPNTWANRHGLPEPPRTARSNALEALVRDHGQRHGWSPNTILRTRLAMRILAGRHTPEGLFRASDVITLQAFKLTAAPVIAVLDEAGLLDDDRVPTIVTWFERTVADLPATMRDELRVWFDVLYRGSATPPRSRPRAPATIRVRLDWALPTLRVWAAAGHTSLREISRADVLAALPPSGNPRATLGQALRSIFQTLRAHKLVFTNPTARLHVGTIERRQPLPVDVDAIRELLNSTNPATAALAALVVFHGLRTIELRHLCLVDVRDGRLHLPDRTVRLAEPARARITDWLDHRQARWPASNNPHLFISHINAGRTTPVGASYAIRALGMAPRTLRADRILDEVIATDGDVRRLSDLFGLSISAAVHYLGVLDPRGLNNTR